MRERESEGGGYRKKRKENETKKGIKTKCRATYPYILTTARTQKYSPDLIETGTDPFKD